MKCKYGDVWLTGLPWQEDTGGVQWSGQQAVQVDDLLRAATPFIAGRGNVVDNLTVPIVRTFGTAHAAARLLAEQIWDLPADGELVFYVTEGDSVLVITYPKAAWSNLTRRWLGQTALQLNFTFTVTGPPVVTTTGTEVLDLYTESGQSLTTES